MLIVAKHTHPVLFPTCSQGHHFHHCSVNIGITLTLISVLNEARESANLLAPSKYTRTNTEINPYGVRAYKTMGRLYFSPQASEGEIQRIVYKGFIENFRNSRFISGEDWRYKYEI